MSQSNIYSSKDVKVSESVDPHFLKLELKTKIDLGHELLKKLTNNDLKKVQGIAKLEKKVKQEIKFLEKFQNDANFPKLKKEHINCSNLLHLDSFITQIFIVEKPTGVLQPFNLCDEGKTYCIVNFIISKL